MINVTQIDTCTRNHVRTHPHANTSIHPPMQALLAQAAITQIADCRAPAHDTERVQQQAVKRNARRDQPAESSLERSLRANVGWTSGSSLAGSPATDFPRTTRGAAATRPPNLHSKGRDERTAVESWLGPGISTS